MGSGGNFIFFLRREKITVRRLVDEDDSVGKEMGKREQGELLLWCLRGERGTPVEA